jgi:uncharacterized protein (DUF433 family)
MTQSPAKTLDDHIEITPNICGGKPRIAGHRITVQHIVIWHDRLGKSADEIAVEYDLSLADIHAGLAYYFDHCEAIDRSIKDSTDWLEEIKKQTPSVLKKKLNSDPMDAE